MAPPSRAKIPTPEVAGLDVTIIRTPVVVGAGPTNSGGGTAGGEKVATNVLASTGPAGLFTGPGGLLLAGADALGLTVATPGDETAALAEAPDGLPAECGPLPATASQDTPPASTTTTAITITSDRGGRGHRAGSCPTTSLMTVTSIHWPALLWLFQRLYAHRLSALEVATTGSTEQSNPLRWSTWHRPIRRPRSHERARLPR